MVSDGKPSNGLSLPESCIFEQVLLTIFVLSVTLSSDLLTSESIHFISVSNWT